MVPSSLLFWSTLSSSKKVSLRAVCPEYLSPATWLSKHNSAPQRVLRATGQIGTESTFAATCNNQLFPTPGKGAHRPGMTRRAGFALAVSALHCSYALPLLGRLYRGNRVCLGHCLFRASARAAQLGKSCVSLINQLNFI